MGGPLQPVEEIVLDEIKSCCPSACPFNWGDSEKLSTDFKQKLKTRLRFRVAWGDEVRKLDAKILKLRNGIETVLQSNTLSPSDARYLKKLLDDT